MADLDGLGPISPDSGDWVVCKCGTRYDRNLLVMCKTEGCFRNLWDLDATPRPQLSPLTPPTNLDAPEESGDCVEIRILTERFVLRPGSTLRIGRRADFETARVLAGQLNVSAEHAEIRNDGGRLFVTDARPSTNGTYVDGVPLPEVSGGYQIKPGQRLRLARNPAVDIEIVWPGS